MPVRMVAIGALLALSVVPAMAADPTIDIKGQQIPLRCSDWKKQDDGSWKLTGQLNMDGASLTGMTLTGGKEVEDLKSMCK